MALLDEIIAHKRTEVAKRKAELPLSAMPPRSPSLARRSFQAALQQSGLAVIAEIKQKSPSGGLIRPDLSVEEMARIYARNGARAISVLTDDKYFGGAAEHVTRVKKTIDLPVLRKEFIIDPYQIYESDSIGADAILLIARVLKPVELRRFLAIADELGLDTIMEVHAEAEFEPVLKTSVRIVGINNRDLDTLKTDLQTSHRLRASIPADRVAISESGIKTRADVQALDAAGFDALLIGESLLRQTDPGAALRQLLGGR